MEPGTCADGSAMVRRRTLRPHGNHNPQHGGQFFMAPDSWHHLEGTYPRDRTFRLYLYDDYARPLTRRALDTVAARVVTSETFDPATRRTTELKAFPLRPSRDGTYLEARIDATALPAEMTAKVRFAKDAPEYRFDFTFRMLTSDAPPAVTTTSRAIAPTRDSPSAPLPDDPLADLPLAASRDERLAQLRTRASQIEGLLERGDFGAVWVPAFAAKDLAVALENDVGELSTAQRLAAEAALRDVVRTAWLLDSVGDAGNRQSVEQAFAAFFDAVTRTLAAFRR